ncbi:hypothetical protein QA634_32350 [Methylobacterium sp. CB376]|uniref:BRO-N domain-containing protein n=1 Tax=unclassified Methylobacterium TaxID=2615210 RepID=UPI0005BA10FB|nr:MULTISPECIES: hypothetical protein [Methylobacterium]WFT79824.1 hypothetical protein QA634_32350 [Methylobacterium nodulans]
MATEGSNAAALRVLSLRFEARHSGQRRRFAVRMMLSEGRLWLLVKDASRAIGWQSNTLKMYRWTTLDPDDWAYTLVQTKQGPQMMALIAREALSSLLSTARKPQARQFKRWLDGLPG